MALGGGSYTSARPRRRPCEYTSVRSGQGTPSLLRALRTSLPTAQLKTAGSGRLVRNACESELPHRSWCRLSTSAEGQHPERQKHATVRHHEVGSERSAEHPDGERQKYAMVRHHLKNEP